jgi:hypothetical protein
MAQLITPFDANQFDPSQGVGGLPLGRHPVVIDSSEVKANSNNDGGYLQLNLKVIDGPATGTIGAYRLNLYHNNPQTVQIAHQQLSAVSHVIGVFQFADSQALHGKPFIIEVQPQKNNAQYTEVKKVFDMNGNEPGKQGNGPAASAPMQGAQGGGFGQGAQQQPAAGQGGFAQGGQAAPAGNAAPAAGGWQQGGQAAAPAGNPAGGAAPGGWNQGGAAAGNTAPPATGGGWQQGGAPAAGAPAQGNPNGPAWGQR